MMCYRDINFKIKDELELLAFEIDGIAVLMGIGSDAKNPEVAAVNTLLHGISDRIKNLSSKIEMQKNIGGTNDKVS